MTYAAILALQITCAAEDELRLLGKGLEFETLTSSGPSSLSALNTVYHMETNFLWVAVTSRRCIRLISRATENKAGCSQKITLAPFHTFVWLWRAHSEGIFALTTHTQHKHTQNEKDHTHHHCRNDRIRRSSFYNS